MSELDDDLDLVQARQRGDAVLLTDATPEGEEIGASLRARGFEVIDVALSALEMRVASDAPRVVIVDIDEEGAIAMVERLHRLAEGAAATVLLVGAPVRSTELDPHLFSQVFERPVDMAELVANVSSVAQPIWSGRTHGTTPPPSYVPRGQTSRPAPMDSDAPSHPDFSSDPAPIDVGSVLPGVDDGEGAAPRLAPTRLSPELEQLLAAAEQRVTAKARPSSIPSADDEVDLILSPELLSVLDEPLEPDDEGPGTGSESSLSGGTSQRAGTSQRLTTATHGQAAGVPTNVHSSVQTIGERVMRAVAPAAPSELPPWTGPPPPPEPDPHAEGQLTQRAGSDHAALRPPARAASERPTGPPDADERWSGTTRNEEEPRRPEAGGQEPPLRPAEAAPHLGSAQGRPPPGAALPPPGGLPASSPLAPPSPVVSSRGSSERDGGAMTLRDLERDRVSRREPELERGGAADGGLVSPPRDVAWRSVPDPELDVPHADRGEPTPAAGLQAARPAPDRVPAAGLGLLPSGAVELPVGLGAVGWAAAAAADEAPESAAPSIATVLGPGDAPRALARAVGSRASGSLAITTEEGARRIVLHDGDLVTAGSGVPEETLLAFLAARGDIERDVAVRLAGKLPPSGRHAGAALIAHGHLSQDDLWPVLRAHAEWLIGHVVLVESGTCELEAEPPGRLKAEPNVFGGATGAEVFVETVRRVIAPEIALRRLGGHSARLDDGVRRALLGECALAREEEELVRAGRGRAVSELCDAGEPEIASVLYALVCLEVLDVLIPPLITVAPSAPEEDPLDEEAIRQRVRARLSLVEDGDYFSILGIPRDATNYEIRRAYLALRRAFEPSALLTAGTVDLLDDVRLVIEVLDEAYDILRDPHRRERYRRAIEAGPP